MNFISTQQNPTIDQSESSLPESCNNFTYFQICTKNNFMLHHCKWYFPLNSFCIIFNFFSPHAKEHCTKIKWNVLEIPTPVQELAVVSCELQEVSQWLLCICCQQALSLEHNVWPFGSSVHKQRQGWDA